MATRHTVSPSNPTYVTAADSYRSSFVLRITPQLPIFGELELYILPKHRLAQGYLIDLLESEEHSAIYIGPVEQLDEMEAQQAAGLPVTLDLSRGVCYDFWPRDNAWAHVIPNNTWTPTGRGIITEFPHRDRNKVVVYEYVDTLHGQPVNMVAYHCDYCHTNHHDYAQHNDGPANRRWIAAKARAHVLPGAHDCTPPNPRNAEIVTAAANQLYNTNRPVVSFESQCSITGPCSVVQHLRTLAC